MSEHTPGPWQSMRSKAPVDGEFDYAISAEGAPVLAEAFGRSADGGHPPAEANARLIAAAPDLLELSQFLIERLDDFERDPLQEDDGEYTLRQFSGHVSPAIERLRAAIAKAKAEAAQ